MTGPPLSPREECSRLEAEIADLRRALGAAELTLKLAREDEASVAIRSYGTGFIVGGSLVAFALTAYFALGLVAMSHLA